MFCIHFGTIFSDIFGYQNHQEPKGIQQSIWDAVCSFFQKDNYIARNQNKPLKNRVRLHKKQEKRPRAAIGGRPSKTFNKGISNPPIIDQFIIPELSPYQKTGLDFTLKTISKGMFSATTNQNRLRSYENGTPDNPGLSDLHPLRFLGEIIKSHKNEFISIMTHWGLVAVKQFFVSGVKTNLSKHAENIPKCVAQFAAIIEKKELEDDLKKAALNRDWDAFINILVQAVQTV